MVPAVAATADRLDFSINGIWDLYPNGGCERHDIRVPSFWDAPQDYAYRNSFAPVTNTGGGASEQWTLESPEEIKFKAPSGNLRREQDLHFQLDPTTAGTGVVSRQIKLKGAGGSETMLTVKYPR